MTKESKVAVKVLKNLIKELKAGNIEPTDLELEASVMEEIDDIQLFRSTFIFTSAHEELALYDILAKGVK